MRQALTYVAALSLGVAGACAPAGNREQPRAERPSQTRDLTLTTASPAPMAQVASAVELGRPEVPKTKTPRRRSVPKPAPAPVEPPAEPVAAPTAAPVAVAAIDMTAPVEMAAGNDRELAPGQTVTMIPVSNGPSTGGGGDLALPTEPGRGVFAGGARGCPHPPRGISGGRPIGISRLP